MTCCYLLLLLLQLRRLLHVVRKCVATHSLEGKGHCHSLCNFHIKFYSPLIIGASRSEPHTSELAGGMSVITYIYVYKKLYIVRLSGYFCLGTEVPRHSAGSINHGCTSSKAHVVKQHVDQPGGEALLQFCMLELEEMRGPADHLIS